METKKKLNLLLMTLMVIVSSCATHVDEEILNSQSSREDKDLVQSFELSKEQMDKFQEKEVAISTVEKPADALTSPVRTKIPEAIPVKAAKKDQKENQELKKAKSKVVADIGPQVAKEVPYPSDYPALFKDYDMKSKSVWAKFKPLYFVGETTVIAISYLGVVAGHITMKSENVVKFGDKMAYHFYGRFKSREAYRYFYELDDNIQSYVDKETFLPIKYSLIQRESKQNVDDLQLFDFEKLRTFHWYKRVKKGADKEEKVSNYIPRLVQDSFSALHFTRGLPLQKGDIYEFPVVTRGKAWVLKMKVDGAEKIGVDGKDVNAIRISAETHFPGVLSKSGDIIFWYSNDDLKRLLKFKAKVKIGSIQGEVVEYRAGTKI